jgi:hypothetical protein
MMEIQKYNVFIGTNKLTKQIPWSTVLLESSTSQEIPRILLHLKVNFRVPQEPATGLYPELDESNPHH